MAKLKVFRTAIGFHDAYVAATSRKAALAAWGSDKNLFAMGAAEEVTDPAFTVEPLSSPGTVIKRERGSLREHLGAAEPVARTEAKGGHTKLPTLPKKVARPRPRPSRDGLDKAEAALAQAQDDAEAQLKEHDHRIAELRRQRAELEARQAKSLRKLEKQAAAAKMRYDQAIDRWRSR